MPNLISGYIRNGISYTTAAVQYLTETSGTVKNKLTEKRNRQKSLASNVMKSAERLFATRDGGTDAMGQDSGLITTTPVNFILLRNAGPERENRL